MSFFDEGDEPRGERSRRAGPRGRPGADASVDPQTLRVRRAIAAGVALLVLILLVVGVNSCVNSQQRNALRDYNRDVTAVGRESEEVVGQAFELLGQDDVNPIDQQTQMNQLRVRSEQLGRRARDLDVPGELEGAQRNLLLALDLRTDAIGEIAERLPASRGEEEGPAEEATAGIAAQTQGLLASDVIWTQRVEALVRQELREGEVSGARVTRSQVFPGLPWLDPDAVADRIGGQAGARGTGGDDQPAPGSHGHGLTSVSVGDVRLDPDAPTSVPATDNLTFTVVFANQGENEERGVRVRLVVRPTEGEPITVNETVDRTAPDQTVTVPIPLGQVPQPGVTTTVEVDVLRVPGEQTVDNNEQDYAVIFTQP
jgi:hypothetical protein